MKIVIVAGDPSGDLHGAHLAAKIKELNPKLELYSAAGANLSIHSHQLINLTDIAVTGIFEVLTYFTKILKIFNLLIKKIEEIKPDAIVLIDFPDFNLRLAAKLKPKGYKIFYYISPQIWAWRKNRIHLVKKYIDKMLVIFPFEEEFYKKGGVSARYVGHPLLETIPSTQDTSQEPKDTIAFLPGSRQKEVKKHLPILIEVKKLLKDYHFKFVIIKHPQLPSMLFEDAKKEGMEVSQDKYKTLSSTYLAISSSGTATLELALLNIPSVVIYKMGFFSWLILKNIVKVDFISMANIIAKKKVFPELIQYDANASAIASFCKGLIDDKEAYARTKDELKKIRNTLGDAPASLNAAREILKDLT